MKDLTPLLRRLDSSWAPEVRATSSAIAQIRSASQELQRSPQSLWRETATALIAQERQFARSAWYARQKVVDLAAINVGAADSHPELLPPIRFGFTVRRGAPHWEIGTGADFRLPSPYPVQALIEEVRLAALDDASPPSRRQQPR